MQAQKPPSKRRFTAAAQAAAIAARRRKQEQASPRGCPEVFVVRWPVANLAFGWEIRRFGAVLLDRSATDFPNMHDARVAGEAALGGMSGR